MARRYAARHLLQIPHDAPPSLARVGFPDLVAPPPVGASSSPQVIAAVDHDPYREQMANPPETAFRQWVGSPWADVALAAGLTLAGQLELLSAEHDGLAQGMALLVQTAPVAIRRSHTVLAAGVGALALTVEATLLDPTNTLAGLVAGLVLVYSVGRHLRRRALFAMTAFMFLAIVAHTAALPRSGTGAEDVAFAALFRSCLKRQPRGVFTVSGNLAHYDDGRRDLRLSLEEHFLEQIEVFNATVFDNGRKNHAHRYDNIPACQCIAILAQGAIIGTRTNVWEFRT